jgi:hypothetical protein
VADTSDPRSLIRSVLQIVSLLAARKWRGWTAQHRVLYRI